MVGVTTPSAENFPLSHLKRATAGTEGVHTISRLGDGKDDGKASSFQELQLYLGKGKKVSSFIRSPLLSHK